MKYIAFFLLLPFVVFAQNTPQVSDDVFTAQTLSAGTVMSARTAATTLNDTTRPVGLRGWASAYCNILISANDTVNIHVLIQGSKDGVTWDATLTTIDSLVNTTSGRYAYKSFKVPDAFMGLQAVRFQVRGQTWGLYASSPVATVKTEIVRKHR